MTSLAVVATCARRSGLAFLSLLIPLLASHPVLAEPTLKDLVAPEVAGADGGAEASGAAPQPTPAQALERTSPRATVEGFLAAVGARNYAEADRFLDLSDLPGAARKKAARKLRVVLDRQLWIEPSAISGDAEGYANDGLAANQDSVGWLETPEGPHNVILVRVNRDGGQRWLFSAASVATASALYDELGYGRLTAYLPAPLIDYQFLNVQLWQWIALLLLVLLAYLAAWIITRAAAWMLTPLTRWTETQIDNRVLSLMRGPVRLLIGIAVFSAGTLPLGLSVMVRTVLSAAEQLLVIAGVAWIVMRVLDVVTETLRERLVRRAQTNAISLLPPGRRTAKVLIVAIAVLAALNSFGFNVTAVLAGLGVGGIAVALAAQKSIENLFGGVTLYADQPVRVGDFCRFGDTVGTVEDIGLRSTRIRTLNRTTVAVPNAEFANLHLENFSKRDKFWYHPTIGLRYETTPDQLRYILVEVRRMLYAHPKVDPTPARVRFTTFNAYSLDLEIFAYILTSDYDGSLEVAEDLNLRIMDIVAAAGSSFAFPSQTTYLENGQPLDAERSRDAERQVVKWREQNALYLPGFPREKIEEISGSLDYPPRGTPGAQSRSDNGGDGRSRSS